MTKLIYCVDCFGNNALQHLKWDRNIGSYEQTLVSKCLSSNPFATSLNMESNCSFISIKLFNCLSLHHKRSQEHDFLPFLQSIRKRVAKGLFERHFQRKFWSFDQIAVPFLSAEVHCYQFKSTKDMNLVIFVSSLFGNYCLNNSGQCNCCFSTFYFK